MYVDDCLKKLFFKMKQDNVFKDTLILVTGDHGNQFAEIEKKVK